MLSKEVTGPVNIQSTKHSTLKPLSTPSPFDSSLSLHLFILVLYSFGGILKYFTLRIQLSYAPFEIELLLRSFYLGIFLLFSLNKMFYMWLNYKMC